MTSSEAQISARLANEVRHLHSLWGQGPPKCPFSEENNSEENDGRNKSFKEDSTQSDEETGNNSEENDGRNKRFKEDSTQSDEETAAVSKNESGWNMEWNVKQPKRFQNSKKRKNEETALLSEKKKPRQEIVQQRAVKAFRIFLAEGLDDESSIEEEEDDGVMKFFVEMFEKDAELRSYYEENYNCGSFECLVCSAIGQRIGKRFTNCSSLIQHASKLRNTRRIASHMGYGRALNTILSGNADRPPNSISSTM